VKPVCVFVLCVVVCGCCHFFFSFWLAGGRSLARARGTAAVGKGGGRVLCVGRRAGPDGRPARPRPGGRPGWRAARRCWRRGPPIFSFFPPAGRPCGQVGHARPPHHHPHASHTRARARTQARTPAPRAPMAATVRMSSAMDSFIVFLFFEEEKVAGEKKEKRAAGWNGGVEKTRTTKKTQQNLIFLRPSAARSVLYPRRRALSACNTQQSIKQSINKRIKRSPPAAAAPPPPPHPAHPHPHHSHHPHPHPPAQSSAAQT
jgi:hypothetical protein